MTVQLLNLSDCEYGFLAGGGAYIRFSDIAIANKYTDRYGKELAITAQKLNGAIKVYYSDQDYFEYPCWLIEKYKDTRSDFEMAELIYYSGTEGIPPQLHDLSRRLFDIDVSAGIVRMGDGKQVVLNDQANCTLSVARSN